MTSISYNKTELKLNSHQVACQACADISVIKCSKTIKSSNLERITHLLKQFGLESSFQIKRLESLQVEETHTQSTQLSLIQLSMSSINMIAPKDLKV